MMRSLYSGVAGLKNHQTRMDVVGNNIANVNTIGYKAGRTTFQDMLSQSIKGASSPTGTTGGVNPLQVGLGMGVASVDNIFTTGSLQATGKNTDLAIDGDGFFMVKSGLDTYYTRAGNFDFDSLGNYVIPGTGLQVMGWRADSTGKIDTSTEPIPLNIPLNDTMPPRATTLIDFQGTLNTATQVGDTVPTSIAVYDSMGVEHQAKVLFTKVDEYTWSVEFDVEATTGGPYVGEVVFDSKGNYLYDTFTSVVDSKVILDTVDTGLTSATDPRPTPNPSVSKSTVDGVTTVTSIEYTLVKAVYLDATSQYSYDYDDTTGTYTTHSNPHWSETIFAAEYIDDPSNSGNVILNRYTLDGGAGFQVCTYYPETDSFILTTNGTYDGTFEKDSDGLYKNTTDNNEHLVYSTISTSLTLTLDHCEYETHTVVTENTIVPTVTPCVFTPANGAADITIALDLEILTQYGVNSDAKAIDQDGYTAGTLDRASLNVDASGIIFGKFSNSQLMNLGQVALAIFTNPGGLTKIGSSLFAQSNNSGIARVGTPGQGSYGAIKPSNLEMSNVDLSEEFTTMITTQRGFQGNSRIITTSDTMLEELVNLKR